MLDQLDELILDQERFTEVITSYKINVRALGNWVTWRGRSRCRSTASSSIPPIPIRRPQRNGWGAKTWHEIVTAVLFLS